jgi:hypothetical protein
LVDPITEGSMDVTLPTQVRRMTDALVMEYVGAIPAGRVIAVAAITARSMVRSAGTDADFLERWEERVRRRLTAELSDDLAEGRSEGTTGQAQPHQQGLPEQPRAASLTR